MYINVKRTLGLKNIHYFFDDKIYPTGRANFTYGIIPIKIRITDRDAIIEIKQSKLAYLNNMPIINVETFTKFFIYEGTRKCGLIKKKLFKPSFTFQIKEEEFLLIALGKNMFAVSKKNKELLQIEKDSMSYKEESNYRIYYQSNEDINDRLKLLFCSFVDMVYFSNKGKISLLKYEIIK